MNKAAKIFLVLNAIAFMLIGIKTTIDPVASLASQDLSPQSITAANELRSIYGGKGVRYEGERVREKAGKAGK